jgi:ribosomal protein S11
MFLTTKIKNKLLLNNNLYYKKQKLLIHKIILLKYCKQKFYQKKKIKNLNKIITYLNDITSLKKKINFFYFSKNFSTIKNISKFFSFNSNLISYILIVTLLKSNIILSITDFQGIPLITYSSGLLNFKGTQKVKYLALNSILKKIKYKSKKLKTKTFAIHFQGIKKNRKRLLNNIKSMFYVKNIKYFNLIAHNGCKPKKY